VVWWCGHQQGLTPRRTPKRYMAGGGHARGAWIIRWADSGRGMGRGMGEVRGEPIMFQFFAMAGNVLHTKSGLPQARRHSTGMRHGADGTC
jgi:hypothetical protein